jgi:hypothetical protein
LEGPALAHRLLAERRAEQENENANLAKPEPAFSDEIYQQALPSFKAALAPTAGQAHQIDFVCSFLCDF